MSDSWSWEPNLEPKEPLSLEDKLLEEAQREDQLAKSFDGCMWLGSEHPSMPHRRRATLLRQAAAAITLRNKPKKKTKP